MVALADSEDEVRELTLIYKYASQGYKFRQIGKDAYKRMKKGDFTNTKKNKGDK